MDDLLTVAGTQRGYVTTADASAVGVPLVELRKLAHRGKLERIAQGLYRISAYPHAENDELMEAALWPGGKGVVSCEAALALWGLADVHPRRIDVTVPRKYNPRKAGGGRYRIRRRDLADIDYIEGIPVVTPSRAVEDAIDAGVAHRFIEQAIRTARRRNLFGRDTEEALRRRLVEARDGAR